MPLPPKWVLLLLFCCQAWSQDIQDYQPMGEEAFDVLAGFFEYDAAVSLSPAVVDRQRREYYQKEKVVFTGAEGMRIPAYLAVPRVRRAPYPCVIVIHELGGDKDAWWDDNGYMYGGRLTRRLLATGHAVLMLDLPFHGERTHHNQYMPAGKMAFETHLRRRLRTLLLHAVVDHRRGLDFLDKHDSIDADRIGVMGYGYGGLVATMLATVDNRVQAVSPVAMPMIDNPSAVYGPWHFAPRLGKRPLFLLAGERDDTAPLVRVKALYKQISGGAKELKTYDSRHRLPESYVEDLIAWYKKNLPKPAQVEGSRGGG